MKISAKLVTAAELFNQIRSEGQVDGRDREGCQHRKCDADTGVCFNCGKNQSRFERYHEPPFTRMNEELRKLAAMRAYGMVK